MTKKTADETKIPPKPAREAAGNDPGTGEKAKTDLPPPGGKRKKAS